MPEGPEIRRAADNEVWQSKANPNRCLVCLCTKLKPYDPVLPVTRYPDRDAKSVIDPLFVGLTLYSHNQLYGVWRVIDTAEIPQTTRILRVRLQTADKTIIRFIALPDIEMLTAEQLTTQPLLQRVGLIADARLTPEESVVSIAVAAFSQPTIFRCCWISPFWRDSGNYLRVEILWQVGLTGQHKAKDLNERN